MPGRLATADARGRLGSVNSSGEAAPVRIAQSRILLPLAVLNGWMLIWTSHTTSHSPAWAVFSRPTAPISPMASGPVPTAVPAMRLMFQLGCGFTTVPLSFRTAVADFTRLVLEIFGV